MNVRVLFLICLFWHFGVQMATAQNKATEQNKAPKLNNVTNNSEVHHEKFRYLFLWSGTDPKMTLEEIAAYCAPIFWPSPDEPELHQKAGKDIRIPAPFPFELPADSPVVYYQLRELLVRSDAAGPAYVPNEHDIGQSVVHLEHVAGLHFDYNHYYRYEAGLGGHDHDTEQAQFKIYVHRKTDSQNITTYSLALLQVTAKAHALEWYDNIYNLDTLSLDQELHLPFHIMVEEGKHASCTDMNGDGYYTPGYDVNVRTNDAWGLRDVIRTGELFSAEFQAWMAKVRQSRHLVLPPLPEDSPYRNTYTRDGVYAPDNAVYQLRPMPAPEKALPDHGLEHDMKSYFVPDWPVIRTSTNVQQFADWWEADMFIKSLSVAYRVNKGQGVSFSFPLLIVKNIEAPLVGGWLVNRLIYQKDKTHIAYGYSLLYTPSASRFLDPYFAVGAEFDSYDVPDMTERETRTDFVFETGIKLRGNVKYSPLKFLGFLTDFWGVRIGIKNRGFIEIENLSYVFEIGAGVW